MIDTLAAIWYILKRNLDLKRSDTVEMLLMYLYALLIPIIPTIHLISIYFFSEIWPSFKRGKIEDVILGSFATLAMSALMTFFQGLVWLPMTHYLFNHSPDEYFVNTGDKTYRIKPYVKHFVDTCEVKYKVSFYKHPEKPGQIVRSFDDEFDCLNYNTTPKKMPVYQGECFQMYDNNRITSEKLPLLVKQKAEGQLKILIEKPKEYCSTLFPASLF